jgi:predicted Fe-Mo cluster-binding NifX family protein
MKLAITIWNGRIAPVFDACGKALALDVEAALDNTRLKAIHAQNTVLLDFGNCSLTERVCILESAHIDELICGALSCEAEYLLNKAGIQIHSFIAGNQDEVLQAWLENKLQTEEFSLPGCTCAHRRRHRRGCGHPKNGISPLYPENHF